MRLAAQPDFSSQLIEVQMQRGVARITVLGATTALLFGACSDSPTAIEPNMPPDRGLATVTFTTVKNPVVDSLAKALALSLADPNLRMRLRDHLRDSPFFRHAIHFNSYLRGLSGRPLALAVAQRLNLSLDSLFAITTSVAQLELVMERPFDRVRWAATPDVVVYGSTLKAAQRVRAVTQMGFTTGGDAVELLLAGFDPHPYLALRPAETNFGTDPEEGRASAVRRSGATISTRNLELMSLSSCDPNEDPYCCPPNVDECQGEPAPGPVYGGVTLPAQFTYSYCRGIPDGIPTGADTDSDGLRDDCEAELAYAFRPRMAMSTADEAPQNEPYWSVARNIPTLENSATVKIFYAFSYYRDPGDAFIGYNPHDGDSEWVVLEVGGNDGSKWILHYATLSAHWGTGSGIDHTARYFAGDLEYPAEYRGRPRIWVSRNKHANYRAANVCNNMWNDDCNTFSGTIQLDMWFDWNANLGNNWHLGAPNPASRLKDCLQSRNQASNGLTGTECFWTNQNYFAGWHGASGQATASPYSNSLSFFGF